MCTVIILRRKGHDWPLLLAANRDEMMDRPWLPPGRHWPDRPQVIAGRDELAGGTWIGINDYGVVAAILNGHGALGPAEGYRSRGELPLEVLEHADAKAAAEALRDVNPNAYRPFNLVIADNRDAYWLSVQAADWGARADLKPLPEGVSMVTARGLNDDRSPRTRTYLPQFRRAAAPIPDSDDTAEGGNWEDWRRLMASHIHDPAEGADGAMTIVTDRGFGTVCSSFIALSSVESTAPTSIFRFAPGPPGETAFEAIDTRVIKAET
ncbi:MAG: NRDE family protein [Rhodospirillales bacterium]|nr:NRDE family protein [Rhodospirillales bacterium]